MIGTLGVIAWANKGQSIESLFYKWKVSPEVPLEVQMAPIGRANIVQTVQAPAMSKLTSKSKSVRRSWPNH